MKRQSTAPAPKPVPRKGGDHWDCGNPFQIVTVAPVRIRTVTKEA
jgi:hypothetical protein